MLLASAIQMSLEARSANSSGSSILGLQAQSQLENLFSAMNEVAKYWPSVEAIYRLFQDVLNNIKAEMVRSLAASDLLTRREQGTQTSHAERVSSNTQRRFLDNQIGLSDQDWNGLLGTWGPSTFFDGDLNGMNI
jgi:transcriptional regulatory protein AMDR